MPLTKLAEVVSDAEMNGASAGILAGLGAGYGMSHADAALRARGLTKQDLEAYDADRAKNFRVIDLEEEAKNRPRASYEPKGDIVSFPQGQQTDKRKLFQEIAQRGNKEDLFHPQKRYIIPLGVAGGLAGLAAGTEWDNWREERRQEKQAAYLPWAARRPAVDSSREGTMVYIEDGEDVDAWLEEQLNPTNKNNPVSP